MATSLDHLFPRETVDSSPFRSPSSARTPVPPPRNRVTHSQHLLQQLAQLRGEEDRIERLREASQRPTDAGITVAIEVNPKGMLDFAKKLEWAKDRIEVLSVIDIGMSEVVTVRVPPGKLAAFERRVLAYQNEDTKPDEEGQTKPKNAALVNVISAFRLAIFDELWTEEEAPPPQDEQIWFQVWLRITDAGAAATQAKFRRETNDLEIYVESGYLTFPGRVVVAVQATRKRLEQALELLDLVAEIRAVRPTTAFFLADLRPFERAAWAADLRNRITLPNPANAPFITLLDTGVANGHLLLSNLVDDADLHAVDPEWGVADHEGHGTEMAGLALIGELTQPLTGNDAVQVTHRLESVKILPPVGANARHLYGKVTSDAVSIVETAHADRTRTFATMTTTMGNTIGRPSEWSALVDRLAFGLGAVDASILLPNDRNPRLFVLAGGNVPLQDWTQYPTVNHTSTVEDPGQAWNAITVGAHTDLTEFDENANPSLTAIAQAGELSPSSRTTRLWERVWPLKPDVVAEGGNGSTCSVHFDATDGPRELRLLTTSRVVQSQFSETGGTSAATAEVARICGHLQARYPAYWPETHRALVIHGARWTRAMRNTLPANPNMNEKLVFLRTFGYGCVDLERSMNSRRPEPTLVVQESITPCVSRQTRSAALGNINIHTLPWPEEQLRDLGATPVELRITLSYFIEPNPARRGWQSKFRYSSHGLRFGINAATETRERFAQRINMLAREEEEGAMKDEDLAGWTLGPALRTRGSIHSDIWSGNAATLAAKRHIAVYPVGGWWKDWRDSARADKPVRYSLIVTLHVLNAADVDIYTPIANEIGIVVPAA